MTEPSLEDILRDSDISLQFYRKQWRFLAPVLREDQPHRELDDRTILPYLSSETVAHGGFAKILKIRVDSSHHQISDTEKEVIHLPFVFGRR